MLVTPQVRSKDLSFSNASVDSRLTVQADRDKLEQVILNLLTNAIKFTLPGGKISIECFADERIVTIVVRDTGVGISSERMPLIFEPFVQATRTLSNPSEGVGLGLAISRDLARAMSGDITVKSMVTVGSEFTLTLPRGQDIAGSDRDSGRSRQQPAA
jgi:signal transduction histidine kinase